MYCTNCAKEIDDKAVACIHCGVSEAILPQNPEFVKVHTKSIFSLVMGSINFVLLIISFVMGEYFAAKGIFKKSHYGDYYNNLDEGLFIIIISSIVFLLSIGAIVSASRNKCRSCIILNAFILLLSICSFIIALEIGFSFLSSL